MCTEAKIEMNWLFPNRGTNKDMKGYDQAWCNGGKTVVSMMTRGWVSDMEEFDTDMLQTQGHWSLVIIYIKIQTLLGLILQIRHESGQFTFDTFPSFIVVSYNL